MKVITKNMIDGIFDDLVEKNVGNKDELRRLGARFDLAVNRTESLLEALTEKMQMAGEILVEYLFNPKKLPSLSEYFRPKGQ